MPRTYSANFSKIRNLVREEDAILLGCAFDKHLRTRVLHRLWKLPDPKLREETLRFLETYTSAKNRKKSFRIHDPLADNQVHPGIWVAARHRLAQKSEGQGVVQELHEVYDISSIEELSGTLPDGQPIYKEIRSEEVLNLFGLQTGDWDGWVFVWSNINPTPLNESTCRGFSAANLVSQLATGYSYHSRRYEKSQTDNTATFAVIFYKPTWTATWANVEKMQESNVDGYNRQDYQEVTGVAESARAAAFTAAQSTSDTDMDVLMTRFSERGKGERVIARMQGRAYTGTADTDAVVVYVDVGLGKARAQLARIWWRRTLAAKTTLIGAGGNAVTDYTYPVDSIDYKHSSVRITDNGDGTYNVYQLMTKDDEVISYDPYDDTATVAVQSFETVRRTAADAETYKRFWVVVYRRMFTSFNDAADYAEESLNKVSGTYTYDGEWFVGPSQAGIAVKPGKVEYVGKGYWAAYQWQAVDITDALAGGKVEEPDRWTQSGVGAPPVNTQ